MTTFQDRAILLRKYSIQFTQAKEYRKTDDPDEGRVPVPIEVFTSVKLPLVPIEWMEMCQSEGDSYVGGCCGAMSALQDRINHVFRFDSGWASCRDLAEMAQTIIEHGDFDGSFIPWSEPNIPIDTLKVRMGSLSIWDKIALCWHLTKDHASLEVPHGSHPNRTAIQRATSVLGRSMHYLGICDMFRVTDDTPEALKPPESQARANRAVILARVLPALKLLNDNIDTLDLGPTDGWALIDREQGPEEVCTNGFGYCVYGSQEEAVDLLRTWTREAAEYEQEERHQHLVDHIGIRPVRVTKAAGIEFTGPEAPLPTPEGP